MQEWRQGPTWHKDIKVEGKPKAEETSDCELDPFPLPYAYFEWGESDCNIEWDEEERSFYMISEMIRSN